MQTRQGKSNLNLAAFGALGFLHRASSGSQSTTRVTLGFVLTTRSFSRRETRTASDRLQRTSLGEPGLSRVSHQRFVISVWLGQ